MAPNDQMKHYSFFKGLVADGAFDKEPLGAYFKGLSARAKNPYLPLTEQEIRDEFGTLLHFQEYAHNYAKSAKMKNKFLPLDSLLCIERPQSVLFIENKQEDSLTLRISSFSDLREKGRKADGVATYAILSAYAGLPQKLIFECHELYAAEIVGRAVHQMDNSAVKEDAMIVDITMQLIKATTLAIEVLAFYDKIGNSSGSPRKLN